MSTVRELHEMECPECKEDDGIDVSATVDVRLRPDGSDADASRNGDTEWDSKSPASCECGYCGLVEDFKIKRGRDMIAAYGWIIDKDHIGNAEEFGGNEAGVVGPSDIARNIQATLRKPEKFGKPFRMLDDDDNLYYEGRIIGGEDFEASFEPLDDFGTPNAGCTDIQYKSKNGEWETI